MSDQTAFDWATPIDTGRPVIVTGAAGFVGFWLSRALLEAGLPVVGFDNLNAYYDPALKRARLDLLAAHSGFRFVEGDLADREAVSGLFDETRPRHVAHMAAQAGVRYSLENPHAYADSNLTGFLNILENCRNAELAHLVYASSSSVYGGNRKLPFSVADAVDHPVSLYAATKKANELMAHAYSHLYDLPATGLRFFTVYGPWGRPDMAYYLFTQAIFAGRPIKVFNHGEMSRDFTYIDDIIEGVVRCLARPPAGDPDFDRAAPVPGASWAPHRVFNIGARRPEPLMSMIAILERETGRKAVTQMLPMQPGDVESTAADVSDLERAVGFDPKIGLEEGLARFVAWFRDFHRIEG
ncbi:MAG: NAD-dependent epimerase [Pseudomonadota bacterium]